MIFVLVPVRSSELADPITSTCAKGTKCKVASMATCVTLTDSRFEPSLTRQKAGERQTLDFYHIKFYQSAEVHNWLRRIIKPDIVGYSRKS